MELSLYTCCFCFFPTSKAALLHSTRLPPFGGTKVALGFSCCEGYLSWVELENAPKIILLCDRRFPPSKRQMTGKLRSCWKKGELVAVTIPWLCGSFPWDLTWNVIVKLDITLPQWITILKIRCYQSGADCAISFLRFGNVICWHILNCHWTLVSLIALGLIHGQTAHYCRRAMIDFPYLFYSITKCSSLFVYWFHWENGTGTGSFNLVAFNKTYKIFLRAVTTSHCNIRFTPSFHCNP